MKFRVRDLDIRTGSALVVILNQVDATMLDLHHGDRVRVSRNGRKVIAVLDIAESRRAVPVGSVGCMEEVLAQLRVRSGALVDLQQESKPESVTFIRKKMDGKELSYAESLSIVRDIVGNRLTDIELASYVTANYAHPMSMREVVDLTRAITVTGDRLRRRRAPVVDLHCIGGVPGNRTTLVVVPILVAAGLRVPKTSSRAITSPSGTADTMEVLAPVSIPVKRLERMLDKVGGFIVWGGAINLAPADDRIINVEHPLSIDAEGQMLASIMAKKASVGATHLLMDLPVGAGSKLRDMREAMHLERQFARVGRLLGIKVVTMITDGREPIGNGIGPSLEARDCLWVLEDDVRAPQDLRRKSVELAGELLEMTGKAKPGKGFGLADGLLRDGSALRAMHRMIRAQGGVVKRAARLPIGKMSYVSRASRSGVIRAIDNVAIARIARLAGSPKDVGSGVFLHQHVGSRVRKGEPVFTVFAQNSVELKYAREAIRKFDGVRIR